MNPSQRSPTTTNLDIYNQSQDGNNFSSTAAATTAAAVLSQPHVPTPNSSSLNGRKRKSSGVPGSRGVANLTPDQLAKKRANDREAQRAIRERTKNTIDGLEQRIRELESQQPFQELQRVALERDRALAECEQLRGKLAMVQSVIGNIQPVQQPQPNLHGMSDPFEQFIDVTRLTESETALATLTAQQSPLPLSNVAQSQQYLQPGPGSSYEQQHLHSELESPHSDTRSSPMSQTAASGSSYSADTSSLRKWPSNVEQHIPPSQFGPSNGTLYEHELTRSVSMVERSSNNAERHDLNYVLSPKAHSASTSPSGPGPPSYPLSSSSDKPIYEQLPIISSPTHPLDSLLFDFLTDCQKQIANGVPIRDVIGPEYPSFESLKDPSLVPSNTTHPLSALFTDIVSKFPALIGLPERIACHYAMFLLMRWMICPCEPCYDRLPDFMRPLKEQLEAAHPIWLDSVAWPIIRLRLITTSQVKFEDFFIPYTSKLQLNWPYPNEQVLISTTGADNQSIVAINPVFESHLRELRNWSLSPIFKTTHPELVDDSVRLEG